ncbi:LysR family transcriptional regulator [Chitinasiproducens palmae]|uniref:LysR family transcriptional regulator n=1 Tax=Chitinasiproducens palmae TaxID=1770053 RepID=UPI000B8793ED|nr:LysR family transcriptional regulator [Chitinasiproducens palmae]
MDKLRAMEVFVAAVDAGSFASAATALNVSAVMVGKYIQALETLLGARLLERTTRRQRLTEIGAVYVERCRDVLASVQTADGVAEALRAQPQGTLRVTAPVSFGAHRLTPVIGDYLAAHPQVRIDLNLNDRIVDLAEEGFDCGIRMSRTLDGRLVARALATSRMYAVASPAWVARHGMPAHPSELEAFPLLNFALWGPSHVWRFTRDDETVDVPVRGQFGTNNGQALLSAAMAGIGVIMQADALLGPAIAAGHVVPLLPDWQLPTRPVHIVRLAETGPSAKVRSFVDYVVSRLGQPSPEASRPSAGAGIDRRRLPR